MDGVGRVLDAAVDEGFLTVGAAAEGLVHSDGFLVGTPPPATDEVAIDLEDRATKKGTPPIPNETGDIRNLRRGAGNPNGNTASLPSTD